MNLDLNGKVALVPGGSGGIGSYVAEVLAECGADLVVGYHSNSARASEVADKAKSLGRKARADQVDASNYGAVKAGSITIVDFGGVDILATCKAGSSTVSPCSRTSGRNSGRRLLPNSSGRPSIWLTRCCRT